MTALDERRAEVVIAIGALKRLNGDETNAPARETTAAARATTPSKGGPPRPTRAQQDHDGQVLTALQGGEMGTRELIAATGLTRYLVGQAVHRLVAQQRVEIHGDTTNRRIALTQRAPT